MKRQSPNYGKIPPPVLSHEDRLKAGLKAVAARKKRALIKEQLASGKISYLQAIHSDSLDVNRMKVIDLLKAIPKVGEVRAKLIMERAGISLSRRIGGLGKNQLEKLEKEMLVNQVQTPLGKLIVISGPGGVGKSTISKELGKQPNIWVSISATTREPRAGEIDGVDYLFLTDEKFDSMVANGEFLEWAEFAGNRYGTPNEPVSRRRKNGQNVILEIEIAGARQIRKNEPGALLVFIAPPSMEELAGRLIERGTDDPARQAARLALAEVEMAASDEFDEVVINYQVEDTVASLVSLLS
mgnify:CR=1 FL=1